MTTFTRKMLIESFWDLPLDVQTGVARFLVGAKLGEIIESHAHGVVEFEFTYFRHGTVHKLVWDDTHKKLLGGSETVVIQDILGRLETPAREAVLAAGERIRQIKIKHDSKDDREFLHVHFAQSDRLLGNVKLEMSGQPKLH